MGQTLKQPKNTEFFLFFEDISQLKKYNNSQKVKIFEKLLLIINYIMYFTVVKIVELVHSVR